MATQYREMLAVIFRNQMTKTMQDYGGRPGGRKGKEKREEEEEKTTAIYIYICMCK